MYQNPGPSDMSRFAEELKLASNYLPKDPKCLFKNIDEAELWRHLLKTIQQAHKIREIRKNLFVNKIRNLEEDYDSPKELSRWQAKSGMLNKLKNVELLLLEAQNELKVKLARRKIKQAACDTFKKSIKHKSLKINIYKTKMSKISMEITAAKLHTITFKNFKFKKTEEVSHLNKKMQNIVMQMKELSLKQDEDTEELDNIIKEVECKIPSNIIWNWFVKSENHSLSRIINLEQNTNPIKDVGNTIQVSMAELSAQHILLYGDILKKTKSIKECQSKYVEFVNITENKDEDCKLELLDKSFRYFFLTTKLQILADIIKRTNKMGDALSNYEAKNIVLLAKIKKIDIDMRNTIQNIEKYDSVLCNTPKKVISVRNTFLEKIHRFQQIIKDDKKIAMSCKQDIMELEAFKELDLSLLPLLICKESKSIGYLLTKSYCKPEYNMPYFFINTFGWESLNTIIVRILQEATSSSFYRRKNHLIYNEYLPHSQNLKTDMLSIDTAMENLYKFQAVIKCKIKEANCMIDFWTKNPLRKYVSHDHLFNGRPYKYYEDLLLEYKKIL